jgi:hypothetical protein
MRHSSPITKPQGPRAALLALLMVATLVPGNLSHAAAAVCDTIPSLGLAAKCGLFDVGTGTLIVKELNTVNLNGGGMCIANGAKASIKKGADINGGNSTLYFGPACDPIPCGPGVTDPMNWSMQDMSGEVADAVNFVQAITDLTPTQTSGPLLNTSATFVSDRALNVVYIDGGGTTTTDGKTGKAGKTSTASAAIQMDDASETITLRGDPADTFVLQVNGSVLFNGGAPKIILDGIQPENVIWDIVETGAQVTVDGVGSDTFGMWLNVAGKIEINDDSDHTGPFIGGNGVKVLGNTNINGPFFGGCPPQGCPNPEISGLSPRGVNIQTPAGPSVTTAKNSNFYFSWFDPSTWEGHIEALRLDTDGTIIDAQDPPQPAIDSSTFQLLDSHVPHWDAGTQIAADGSRTIYTTVGGNRVTLTTGNVTEADMSITLDEVPRYPNYPDTGILTSAQLHAAIIKHVNGVDVFDQSGDGDQTDPRPFVLGDVFHSNPTLIGPPATPLQGEAGFDLFVNAYKGRDWVLYAGSNDGMLHALDAGETWDGISTYDPGTGDELFGYVPALLLPWLKIAPINSFRTQYFVDGEIVASDAWLGDLDSSGGKSRDDWATVLITGLREGGPGYMALDVTDPSKTTSGYHGPYPKLLWEFTHANLGNSWSKPIITRLKVEAGSGDGDSCGKDDGDGDCREQWVAIFAGGYARGADPNSSRFLGDSAHADWNPRGRSLFVVALDTGAVLASVEYDSAGVTGPSAMLFAIPATPAVLDTNQDGFADVLYVGDLGGQMWKWDLSRVGIDSAGDTRYDNWPAGVFFRTPPVEVATGEFHFKSFYATPAAAFTNNKLVIAFGSGERNDLTREGVTGKDDNNRFYVIPDTTPTGAIFPLTPLLEASLTNVTSLLNLSPGVTGFYFVGEEHEKFVTDAVIFADHVLLTSYLPALLVDGCGPGTAYFYAFRVDDALGHFTSGISDPLETRRTAVGDGVASAPRIKVARNPDNDAVYVTTSEGEVLTLDPPTRMAESSYIYWKQVF